MPADIVDEEVVLALQRKREEVIANPQSANAWGDYGLLLLAQLFDREADFCFSEASRLNPDDPRWHYTRGYIATKKDAQNAEGLYKKAIATSGPGDQYRSVARLQLGDWLLEQGKPDEAESLYTQEMGPPPGKPRAVYGLAMVASARGENEKANELMKSVAEDEHVKKHALIYFANRAKIRGDDAEASRYQKEAARLLEPPAWPDPIFDYTLTLAVGRRGRERLIQHLERENKFYEVLDIYNAELEKERTPKLLIGAGVNYMRIKEYDRAIALLKEAVERDPNSPNATYNVAIAIFTRAEREADINPGSTEVAKWFREVIVYAKRTTELKPDHDKAYLFWGLSLKHLGDPKGAIDPLQKGLIARPENSDLHVAMGQVLAQLGNKTEAEKYFKNAQSLNPNDPSAARELEKLHGKKP
jgi:tetratricopeptide (TPR) repeat protein